jgi:sulfide:quinone oxidoreductase
MSVRMSGPDAFGVLIAGAGVAGLEAALALRALAGDGVRLTLLSPARDFVYRPLTVREPFASGAAARYPLADIARDVRAPLVKDAVAWVEPAEQTVHTAAGEQLSYDALLLALGARAHPRYAHAITIDDRRMDEALHGLVQDIEGGYVKSVVFLAPPRMPWPLPIYELALLTAGRAYDMDLALSVTVVTPEDEPLAIFGAEASAGVAELLRQGGVASVTSAYAEVPAPGEVVIHPGRRRLRCDRVVALPELFGPAMRGLPGAAQGFIPADRHGRVRGLERVFAAGDATDFALKYGGVSAQQADAAAESIAALAGVQIDPREFDPVIHGVLLTAAGPKYLTAHITGGSGFSSAISDAPTWAPPRKIDAQYLAPYLDAHERSPRERAEAS